MAVRRQHALSSWRWLGEAKNGQGRLPSKDGGQLPKTKMEQGEAEEQRQGIRGFPSLPGGVIIRGAPDRGRVRHHSRRRR